MRVSVCMATYNGAEHIIEQMLSILNQKFTIHDVELEVIVSDNNSSDDTIELIRNLNDSRVKIISHAKKKYRHYKSLLSVTKNFENAIKNSTGEFVFLSDQDDIWYPNKIDTMLTYLSKKPCCICSFDWINQKGEPLGTTIFKEKNPTFITLLKRFPYYGFCFAFNNRLKERILPIPLIPQHDIFIGLIASIRKELVICTEVLCAHRKYIEDKYNANCSDSALNESFIVKLYYRLKLLFNVSFRAI